MKIKFLSIMVVGALLLGVGCKNKTTESTDLSSSSDVVSNVSSSDDITTETTYGPPQVIDVGNFGAKKYTLNVYTKGEYFQYVGQTGVTSFRELLQQIADNTEFTFEIEASADDSGSSLAMVNGWSGALDSLCPAGYFATYINGVYVDDISILSYNTMLADENEMTIKYTYDNVLNSETIHIPTLDDIYKVSIIDMRDDKMVETYTYLNDEFTYELEEDVGNGSYKVSMGTEVSDKLPTVKDIVLNTDLKVLGNVMPSSDPEYKNYSFIVIINDVTCLSNSSEIIEFINTIESKPIATTETYLE